MGRFMTTPSKNELKLVLAPLGLKVCWRCESLLELAGFNKKASNPDGLQSFCRTCQNDRNLADYYKHSEKRRSGFAKWRAKKIDKARKSVMESSASRDPLRMSARRAAHCAKRRGVLVAPLNCSICGRDDKLQMHHESYEEGQWLDVD